MNLNTVRQVLLFLLFVCIALPSQARFLTEDEWQGDQSIAPSLNKYLYAYQNPTVYVDPNGRAPVLAEMTNGLFSQADYINRRALSYRKQGGFTGHLSATFMNVGAGVHNVLGGAVGLVNTVADVGIASSASGLEQAGVEFQEYGVVADSRAHLKDVGAALVSIGNTAASFHDRNVRAELGRGLVETSIGAFNGDAEALNNFTTNVSALGSGGAISKLNPARLVSNPRPNSHPSNSNYGPNATLATENPSGIGAKLANDNKFFTSHTNYQAPDNGTGYNYKVYQHNIDPDLNVELKDPVTGISKFETNRERMNRGLAPYVLKNGEQVRVELHHSRQNAQGSLFELSETTHWAKTGQGGEALHPYKTKRGRSLNGEGSGKSGKQHPTEPIDRRKFNTDREQYYKERIEQIDSENN